LLSIPYLIFSCRLFYSISPVAFAFYSIYIHLYIFSCRIFYTMSPLLFFISHLLSPLLFYNSSPVAFALYSIYILLSPFLFHISSPVAFAIPYIFSCPMLFYIYSPIAFALYSIYILLSPLLFHISSPVLCYSISPPPVAFAFYFIFILLSPFLLHTCRIFYSIYILLSPSVPAVHSQSLFRRLKNKIRNLIFISCRLSFLCVCMSQTIFATKESKSGKRESCIQRAIMHFQAITTVIFKFGNLK
jgi:hypothetical protein